MVYCSESKTLKLVLLPTKTKFWVTPLATPSDHSTSRLASPMSLVDTTAVPELGTRVCLKFAAVIGGSPAAARKATMSVGEAGGETPPVPVENKAVCAITAIVFPVPSTGGTALYSGVRS